MFDIGWTELLVIGVVALIVVGPKDLPGMFRTLGRFTGKMRGMAREFQKAMNDAADQAGASDLKKMGEDLKSATSPRKMGLDRLNDAADRFEKWDPAKAAKPDPNWKSPESGPKKGPATQKLADERAAAAEKLKAASAQRASDRVAKEAAALDEAPVEAKPVAKPAAPKKTAATPKPKSAAKPRAKAAPGTKTQSAAAPKAAAKPKATAKPKAKPAPKRKPKSDDTA